MKTIEKVQKTGNQKSNKVMSTVFATVVGLALISSTEVLTLIKIQTSLSSLLIKWKKCSKLNRG